MSSFLLVYNRRTGRLEHQEFPGEHGRHRALRRRLDLERTRKSKDIEVVVLSADSLDEIKQTHGRYFRTASGLLRETAEPDGLAPTN